LIIILIIIIITNIISLLLRNPTLPNPELGFSPFESWDCDNLVVKLVYSTPPTSRECIFLTSTSVTIREHNLLPQAKVPIPRRGVPRDTD
jgi:hypothetical protein